MSESCIIEKKSNEEDRMEHVSHQDAVKKQASQCIIWEYPMQNKEMNIGVAEIRHRYPEEGFALNEKCSEMGYCLKGSGKLVTEHKSIDLHEGDVVYIPHGEKYYWEGHLTVILPCTPAWYPEQHKIDLNHELLLK